MCVYAYNRIMVIREHHCYKGASQVSKFISYLLWRDMSAIGKYYLVCKYVRVANRKDIPP